MYLVSDKARRWAHASRRLDALTRAASDFDVDTDGAVGNGLAKREPGMDVLADGTEALPSSTAEHYSGAQLVA